jgi:hypothetical protein
MLTATMALSQGYVAGVPLHNDDIPLLARAADIERERTPGATDGEILARILLQGAAAIVGRYGA